MSSAPKPAIVLSIAPRWVDLILSGRKTVELRRRGPRDIGVHRNIVIYATKPVCAIVAVGAISEVIKGSPDNLWDAIGPTSGCTKSEFFEYFGKVTAGTAMRLVEVRSIPAIGLSLLRSQLGWHPPVSWMSAGTDLIELVSRA
jgi:predicted transcriptional regulator